MEKESKKARAKKVSVEPEVTSPVEAVQEPAVEGSQEHAAEEQGAAEVVEVSLKEYEEMKRALEEARQQSSEYFEGWQRERADFINYKKRIEREQATLAQTLAGEILKKYLVILDDMERALKTRPTEGEGAEWAAGIELIYRKLQGILEGEGISRIPAENEMFDPNRHEAISNEDSPDHKSGEVIEVCQQGYLIGDRVLRPALVRVAR